MGGQAEFVGNLARETVQALIQQCDIIELISEFVPLTKAGKGYRGLCPFHIEKTPSFMVNPEKQIFHCFGCGVGGDIISFLMKYENWSFRESVDFLAKRQGIVLPTNKETSSVYMEDQVKEQIVNINELSARYFHQLLNHQLIGKRAREYLGLREISSAIIEEFGLGYTKESRNDLVQFLKKNKISSPEAMKAGLVSCNQEGKDGLFFDRFRGRIIFPIRNVYGQVIAFGGRKIKEDDFGPKYLNSPETAVYSKSRSLYGLYQAKRFIRGSGYVLVVEGYFDFLTLYQHGFKNTIATLGTALTPSHVQLLSRFTNKVIMLYDADPAGISAMLRGFGLFQQREIEIRILLLPDGFDPDLFIRQFGSDELNRLIKTSISAIEFFINQSIERGDLTTIEGKSSVVKEILGVLAKISDPLVRTEYLKKIASRLDVRENILLEKIQFIMTGKDSKSSSQKPIDANELKADEKAEQMLIRLLCRGDITIEAMDAASITIEDFRSDLMREIAKAIFSFWQKEKRLRIEELLFSLKDEKLKEMITSFICLEMVDENIQEVYKDCVARLKSRNQIKKLEVLQNEIINTSANDPELDKLLVKYLEIRKRI